MSVQAAKAAAEQAKAAAEQVRAAAAQAVAEAAQKEEVAAVAAAAVEVTIQSSVPLDHGAGSSGSSVAGYSHPTVAVKAGQSDMSEDKDGGETVHHRRRELQRRLTSTSTWTWTWDMDMGMDIDHGRLEEGNVERDVEEEGEESEQEEYDYEQYEVEKAEDEEVSEEEEEEYGQFSPGDRATPPPPQKATQIDIPMAEKREAEAPRDREQSGGHEDSVGDHEAFVTMVTTDDFVIGAETMLHSLREHCCNKTAIKTRRRATVVMVTPGVSEMKRQALRAAADEVIEVEPIAMPAKEAADHDGVPTWAQVGYTKLRLWGLTQYKRIVYIDADALVMEDLDELFDREVDLAAAPDVFPPDKFNAGVMVVVPSLHVLDDMLSKVDELPAYDGGDTGFLNAYFSDWFSRPAAARLPFKYNAQRTVYWTTHDKNPGYWEAIGPVKILHFCSSPKPWEEAKRKGDLEMIWWQSYVQMKMSSVPGMRGF
eukprot:g16337.t1